MHHHYQFSSLGLKYGPILTYPCRLGKIFVKDLVFIEACPDR